MAWCRRRHRDQCSCMAGCGRLLVQSGEEPADLVAGQRDQLGGRAGRRLGRGQDGQERVGEQGQDGPAVPGGPAADLVLVQGGQFLAGSEPVLDLPPGAGDPHQLGQWHRAGGMGAVEGVLAVADAAADQQPVRPVAFGDGWVGDLD